MMLAPKQMVLLSLFLVRILQEFSNLISSGVCATIMRQLFAQQNVVT